MQVVYIDLIPQTEKPVVNASQFDNNRHVRFYLLENGAEYTLAGTETVTCEMRKPDGNIVIITPTIGPDKFVDVYFTEQACACYGQTFGELSIVSGTDKLGTCNFYLEVEKSPTAGGIVSHSEIDNLTAQINAITLNYLINNTDEIAEIIANKIYPTLEVSGDIVTFNTILQLPLVSVTSDPLATEITRCGDNLLDLDKCTIADPAYGLTITRNGNEINIYGTATDSGNLSFRIISDYDNYLLSGKGLIIQALDITPGYNIGQIWGFRTPTEKQIAIRLDGITLGQNVNMSLKVSVAQTALDNYKPYNGITKPIADATTIPTLTGVNNVFTDNGLVTVEYKYFPDI